MDRDFKGEALYNDNRLHDLAVYASTSGYAVKAGHKIIRNKFNEFKRLIKSGEFDNIDELENSIYERFGILGPENKSGITQEDMNYCDDMYEDLMKRDAEKKEKEKHE